VSRTRSLLLLMALASVGVCLAKRGPETLSSSPMRPRLVAAAFARDSKVSTPPACPAKFEDSLETNGVAPIGRVPGVAFPKALHTTEAEFSDQARREINDRGLRPFASFSTISLVVDKDGKPRDLCVAHSAEFDLDRQAAKAVWQYRFEPAMKDGHPVAKRIDVVIRFAIR
jgi:TonB family protein